MEGAAFDKISMGLAAKFRVLVTVFFSLVQEVWLLMNEAAFSRSEEAVTEVKYWVVRAVQGFCCGAK